MEYAETKKFPEFLPNGVKEILDAMSIEKKHIRLFGSMNIRSQLYAGDYDANEVVYGSSKELSKGFQGVIRNLLTMKDIYIGDIKLGEILEWRILSPKARIENGKIVGFNQIKSKKQIQHLLDQNVLSPKEAQDAYDMVSNISKPMDLLLAKDTLKYHVIRWTPKEVLNGQKEVRGKVITLEESWKSSGVKKLDVIGKDGDRFTDFSMVYVDKHTRKINIEVALKEDIFYYLNIRQPFKALKRTFALFKLNNDYSSLSQLTHILNSDLGRLYHIIGDIRTLIDLLEYKNIPIKEVKEEIDRFRSRLSNIYTLKDYLRNETEIFGNIYSILKLPRDKMSKRLEQLSKTLQAYLNSNTYRMIGGYSKEAFPTHSY